MRNTRLYKPVAYALDWPSEDIEWIYGRFGKGSGITLPWIEGQMKSRGHCYEDCPRELTIAFWLLKHGWYGFWKIDCEYCGLFQIGKLSFLIHLEMKCSKVPRPVPYYRLVLLHISFGDSLLFQFRFWNKFLKILKYQKCRWANHLELKILGKNIIHWRMK